MCAMTHLYVCHDSFIRVPWLIHDENWFLMMLVPQISKIHVFLGLDFRWWELVSCVPWLIHTCAMTHSFVFHDSSHMCAWLIHMCAWLIHTFAVTHSQWELISDVALVPHMPEIRVVCAERINFEEILEWMVWIDENWFSWEFDENRFEVISIENWFEVWIDEKSFSLWSLWWELVRSDRREPIRIDRRELIEKKWWEYIGENWLRYLHILLTLFWSRRYQKFMQMLVQLVKGDIETSKFEDDCRYIHLCTCVYIYVYIHIYACI